MIIMVCIVVMCPCCYVSMQLCVHGVMCPCSYVSMQLCVHACNTCVHVVMCPCMQLCVHDACNTCVHAVMCPCSYVSMMHAIPVSMQLCVHACSTCVIVYTLCRIISSAVRDNQDQGGVLDYCLFGDADDIFMWSYTCSYSSCMTCELMQLLCLYPYYMVDNKYHFFCTALIC